MPSEEDNGCSSFGDDQTVASHQPNLSGEDDDNPIQELKLFKELFTMKCRIIGVLKSKVEKPIQAYCLRERVADAILANRFSYKKLRPKKVGLNGETQLDESNQPQSSPSTVREQVASMPLESENLDSNGPRGPIIEEARMIREAIESRLDPIIEKFVQEICASAEAKLDFLLRTDNRVNELLTEARERQNDDNSEFDEDIEIMEKYSNPLRSMYANRMSECLESENDLLSSVKRYRENIESENKTINEGITLLQDRLSRVSHPGNFLIACIRFPSLIPHRVISLIAN